MTTGIYSLYWEEQDLIYIGLSQNIESRLTEHLYKMKNSKHTNYKVQNAFNKYGEPKLIIIEECSIKDLNDREVFWTKEFDSINTGLNIVEAGQVGFGTNSSASKYSKRTVLKVFSLLYRTGYSQLKISSKLNVERNLVQDISSGSTHLWLKDTYPSKYFDMFNNNSLRRKNGHTVEYLQRKQKPLVSPEGVVYTDILNIKEFCYSYPSFLHDKYNFWKGIGRVLVGSRKSYKGWKLQTE